MGVLLSLGGAAFTSALGSGNYGNYPDARDWGADSQAGIVPAGARFAGVSIQAVKVDVGTAIDGYVDNVNISINPVLSLAWPVWWRWEVAFWRWRDVIVVEALVPEPQLIGQPPLLE